MTACFSIRSDLYKSCKIMTSPWHLLSWRELDEARAAQKCGSILNVLLKIKRQKRGNHTVKHELLANNKPQKFVAGIKEIKAADKKTQTTITTEHVNGLD
jgi:hypothetical protein